MDLSLDARLRLIREKSKDAELVNAHTTLINFLRGMIGPGCFSVPLAFKYAGLWVGFGLVFIVGVITAINMMKLVKCSQYLCALTNTGSLNYGNMAFEAFRNSFPSFQRHAGKAKFTVNFALFLLQIGVCSVGYVFLVDHLLEICQQIWSDDFPLDDKALILVMFLPFCALVSIRSFWILSCVSYFGNAIMITALVTIFVELVITKNMIPELPLATDFNGIILAAGSILYAFEGQAIVLPVENKLKHASEMRGFTGVLCTGMSLSTICYAALGFFGYIAYGPRVEGSITLNMPSGSGVIFAVKCMLASVMFTGFLLQHYVIVEMTVPEMRLFLETREWKNWQILLLEYFGRYLVVLSAMALAIAVPNLGDIISLVGVSIGMILAFIVPPILEWVTFLPVWAEKNARAEMLLTSTFNALFVTVGLVFMGFGLSSNIKNLKHS